jgi:hypothetical protein
MQTPDPSGGQGAESTVQSSAVTEQSPSFGAGFGAQQFQGETPASGMKTGVKGGPASPNVEVQLERGLETETTIAFSKLVGPTQVPLQPSFVRPAQGRSL